MERTPRESAASGMTFMLPSPRRRPIRRPLEWCPRNPLARGAGRGGGPLRGTVASARCRRRKPHSRGSLRVPGAGCDSACSAEGPPAPPGALSTSFWDRTLASLLNIFHGLVVEPEVMAHLVHHDVADQLRHLFRIGAVFLDGTLIDVDGIRQNIAVGGVAPGQINTALEAV